MYGHGHRAWTLQGYPDIGVIIGQTHSLGRTHNFVFLIILTNKHADLTITTGEKTSIEVKNG